MCGQGFWIGLLSIGFGLAAQAQEPLTPCERMQHLRDILTQQHYRPKPVDDSLAWHWHQGIMRALDPEKRFFLADEAQSLQQQAFELDDALREGRCDWMLRYQQGYRNAIQRLQQRLQWLRQQPLAFESSDTLYIQPEKAQYARNLNELQHRLALRVQFNTLRMAADWCPNADSVHVYRQRLPEFRDKTWASYDCWVHDLERTDDQLESDIFNALTHYFDPHTDYMSAHEKSAFYAMVSPDNMSFGLFISINEKEQWMVEHISPGSAADHTGRIHQGDQLLRIESQGHTYTMGCNDLAQVETVFTSPEFREATFYFRDAHGGLYSQHLVKSTLKDYGNSVYSYVVHFQGHRWGYVYIPSFYSQFETGQSNVSDDVKREIDDLTQAGIEGLCLDVQDNGGGSFDEAMRLTGMFLPQGVMAQWQGQGGMSLPLSNPFTHAHYTGPLVVLCSAMTASAAEFLCQALQDQRRALIAGGTTFGKTTMQQIFPLDDNQQYFVKLTQQQFFGARGQSCQYTGLTPDLPLPQLGSSLIEREAQQPFALQNSFVLRDYYARPSLPRWWTDLQKLRKTAAPEPYALQMAPWQARLEQVNREAYQVNCLRWEWVYQRQKEQASLGVQLQQFAEKSWPFEVNLPPRERTHGLDDPWLISTRQYREKALLSNATAWLALQWAVRLFQSKK